MSNLENEPADRFEKWAAKKQAELADKEAVRRGQKPRDSKQEAADSEMAGRQIAVAKLSSSSPEVKVFQNGYVTFRTGFGSPFYEKLISFDVFSDNITKKSGLGRGAAAFATLGANLLSANNRGDFIVTILTDKKTHSIKARSSPSGIKLVNSLQAAANSVLSSIAEAPSNPSASEDNVSSSLEKLVSLRDSGALSQEEFEKAKGKLLD